MLKRGGRAITKKIIGYMDRKITVEFEEGKAGIFMFTLPKQDVVK
jgi:signal transduction histidine kinase